MDTGIAVALAIIVVAAYLLYRRRPAEGYTSGCASCAASSWWDGSVGPVVDERTAEGCGALGCCGIVGIVPPAYDEHGPH